jgi:hypothetical protein
MTKRQVDEAGSKCDPAWGGTKFVGVVSKSPLPGGIESDKSSVKIQDA